MIKNPIKALRISHLLVILIALTNASAHANTTGLFYISSPTSWVGQGETVVVTPDDGFTFNVRQCCVPTVPDLPRSVHFGVDNFALQSVENWWYFEVHSWDLTFSAPIGSDLTVGFYDGATRLPFFNYPTDPGLDFDGNGRGNNSLTGSFQILEAVYGANGDVLSFAADFTQFDQGVEADWVKGGIRYNSAFAIPMVPEPETYKMLLVGLAIFGFVARRSKRKVNKRGRAR